jgi:hypothetical protein
MKRWMKCTAAFMLAGAMMAPGVQAADKQPELPKNIKVGKALLTEKSSKTIHKGKKLEGLADRDVKNMGKLPLPSQSLAVEPDAANNHDPNNAIFLNLDTVYQDAFTAEKQDNWYYVYVPTAGKLTVRADMPDNTALDYDLYLYKLNMDTYTLENPVFSQYGPGDDEQVSMLVEPGYYFIRTHSYQGYDANASYLFEARLSTSPDENEPDDNAFQAPLLPSTLTLNGTVDNDYDQDWFLYNVTEPSRVYFNLQNSGASTYQLNIFNNSLAYLGSVNQNGYYSAVLGPGTYAFQVNSRSGSGDAYSLNMFAEPVDYNAGLPATPNNENYNSVFNKIKAANPGISYYGIQPLGSVYLKSYKANGVTKHFWAMNVLYVTSFYLEDYGYIVYDENYKSHRLLDNGYWKAGFGGDFGLTKGIFMDDERFQKYDWAEPHEYHYHYIHDFLYNRDYTFEYHDYLADQPYFTSTKTSNEDRIIYGRAEWYSDGSGRNVLTRIDRATGAKITTNNILFSTNAEFENGYLESENVYVFYSTKANKTYRIDLNTLQEIPAP